MTNFFYNASSTSVVVVIDKENYVVQNSDKRYEAVLEACTSNDVEKVKIALQEKQTPVSDINKTNTSTTSNVESRNDLTEYFISKFKDIIDTNTEEKLKTYLDRVSKYDYNKSYVDAFANKVLQSTKPINIIKFMVSNSARITPEGDILAWRTANLKRGTSRNDNQFTDRHTGTMVNNIGNIVSMDRNACDHNDNNTCSRGLHICGVSYIPSFGGNIGKLVIIDPRDFVAVPNDYQNAKVRTCKFVSYGLIKDKYNKDLRSTIIPNFTVEYDQIRKFCDIYITDEVLNINETKVDHVYNIVNTTTTTQVTESSAKVSVEVDSRSTIEKKIDNKKINKKDTKKKDVNYTGYAGVSDSAKLEVVKHIPEFTGEWYDELLEKGVARRNISGVEISSIARVLIKRTNIKGKDDYMTPAINKFVKQYIDSGVLSAPVKKSTKKATSKKEATKVDNKAKTNSIDMDTMKKKISSLRFDRKINDQYVFVLAIKKTKTEEKISIPNLIRDVKDLTVKSNKNNIKAVMDFRSPVFTSTESSKYVVFNIITNKCELKTVCEMVNLVK